MTLRVSQSLSVRAAALVLAEQAPSVAHADTSSVQAPVIVLKAVGSLPLVKGAMTLIRQRGCARRKIRNMQSQYL